MSGSVVGGSESSGSRRRRRVGVLELMHDSGVSGLGDRVYTHQFRRQFVSLTPQAVSVWCRQLGHEVFYAVYCGERDPKELLPADLDVVFIAAYTKAGPLAYALAKLFRKGGALTVLGGPHARAFPDDCLRFFDVVVGDCDRDLIDDIVRGRFDPGSWASTGIPLRQIPSVEERVPELLASTLRRQKTSSWNIVPMLASTGCPYTCDFCVDWNSNYAHVPEEALEADLLYVAEHWPKVLVGYHDPNFGVLFDRTMELIERIPEDRRSPYIMESSLAVLKPARLERLQKTRCVYVAPGIESWAEYGGKAGTGVGLGEDKLEQVVDHFHTLRRYIEGFQANFVFGSDADRGTQPLELTKEFIRRVPFVWPGINIPTPFGGTPLFEQLLADDRILAAMPFTFYYNPYLTFVPAHYEPAELYDHLIDLFAHIVSPATWRQRLTSGAHPRVKIVHSVQAFGAWQELIEFRRIRRQLAADASFRRFHDGSSERLPEFYQHRFERRLGRYADLLTSEERIPRLYGPIAEAIRQPRRRDDVEGPEPLDQIVSSPASSSQIGPRARGSLGPTGGMIDGIV